MKIMAGGGLRNFLQTESQGEKGEQVENVLKKWNSPYFLILLGSHDD